MSRMNRNYIARRTEVGNKESKLTEVNEVIESLPGKSLHIFALIMAKKEGYQKLAALMGSHPCLSIYRQFAALNFKNLLYMQAELVHLEAQLSAIVQEDNESRDPKRDQLECCWILLKESANMPGKNLQWDKMMQIRERLKEYSQCRLFVHLFLAMS